MESVRFQSESRWRQGNGDNPTFISMRIGDRVGSYASLSELFYSREKGGPRNVEKWTMGYVWRVTLLWRIIFFLREVPDGLCGVAEGKRM